MTVNTKKAPMVKSKHNELLAKKESGKTTEFKHAEVVLSARTHNAITVKELTKRYGDADLTALMEVLFIKAANIKNGDLSDLEGRLAAQSVVLDVMFNEMAVRAASNVGTHMAATEAYTRMALKAQAQCAKTIEVLATMKNPPVVFAKQANISHGHQQVNNATNTQPPTHAGKIITNQNELLSEMNNATMDTRGTTATSETNQAMEAMGTQHRCGNI